MLKRAQTLLETVCFHTFVDGEFRRVRGAWRLDDDDARDHQRVVRLRTAHRQRIVSNQHASRTN